MSYKCEVTGKRVLPGVPQVRKIVEQREKVYYYVDEKGRQHEQGRGFEIVREISICPVHAEQPGATAQQACGAKAPEQPKSAYVTKAIEAVAEENARDGVDAA